MVLRKRMLAVALATAAMGVGLGLAGEASADTVIDFESLRHDDASIMYHGATYSEDGFTLSAPGAFGFGTFGTLETRFSGSTALFNDTPGDTTTLTKDGGGAFDLLSIDIAELNGSVVADVTFIGTLSGGGTVSQTFTLDGVAFAAETFLFSGFTSVVSVAWDQEFPYHQFDNITIANGVSVVPTPGAAAGGMALLALGAIRRRRTA